MEEHTFDVMYEGFCAYWKGKGWPNPDRSAILEWEAWKSELVKRLVAIETEERKNQ